MINRRLCIQKWLQVIFNLRNDVNTSLLVQTFRMISSSFYFMSSLNRSIGDEFIIRSFFSSQDNVMSRPLLLIT